MDKINKQNAELKKPARKENQKILFIEGFKPHKTQLENSELGRTLFYGAGSIG